MGRKKNKRNNLDQNNQQNQPLQLDQQDKEPYTIDEYVGVESTDLEFKEGAGFLRHKFCENVARYACGFANSGQNGTLMLGVNDLGIVTGCTVFHQEADQIRRNVNDAMKRDVQPQIFQDYYGVVFVPVRGSDGNIIANLYVIEIFVKGKELDTEDEMFSSKGQVFIRRDGSIQTLQPQDIPHFQKMKRQHEINELKKNYQGEIDKLQKENESLNSAKHKLSDKLIQQTEEANRLIQQQALSQPEAGTSDSTASGLEEINKKLELLVEERTAARDKKSKVCVIS